MNDRLEAGIARRPRIGSQSPFMVEPAGNARL